MQFRAWMWAVAMAATAAQAQEAPAGSVERGQRIFIDQLCHNCHGTVGHGGGVAGLKIAGRFSTAIRAPVGDRSISRQAKLRGPTSSVASNDTARRPTSRRLVRARSGRVWSDGMDISPIRPHRD